MAWLLNTIQTVSSFCVLNSRINLSVYLVTTAYRFSMEMYRAKIFKDWHQMGGLEKLGMSQQELLDLRLSDFLMPV